MWSNVNRLYSLYSESVLLHAPSTALGTKKYYFSLCGHCPHRNSSFGSFGFLDFDIRETKIVVFVDFAVGKGEGVRKVFSLK